MLLHLQNKVGNKNEKYESCTAAPQQGAPEISHSREKFLLFKFVSHSHILKCAAVHFFKQQFETKQQTARPHSLALDVFKKEKERHEKVDP
jgi:hypothetical protein